MMPKRPKPQISKRRSCDRFMTTDDKKGELVNGVWIPDVGRGKPHLGSVSD